MATREEYDAIVIGLLCVPKLRSLELRQLTAAEVCLDEDVDLLLLAFVRRLAAQEYELVGGDAHACHKITERGVFHLALGNRQHLSNKRFEEIGEVLFFFLANIRHLAVVPSVSPLPERRTWNAGFTLSPRQVATVGI